MHERDDVAAWVRARAAQAVLQRVVNALDEANISVLPVKGVVTARLLYKDIAERPMRDIDIRVGRLDLPMALDVARARGWLLRSDSPRMHEAVFGVDGWEVDVECTLGQPGLCAVTVEQVLRRASTIADPFPHLEPELHDHALILALNAFKGGLGHTPWSLEDLRRIVRLEGFEPSVLVERAREGRVLSALWIVADWLSEREGAIEWRMVREMVGPLPPSARVAKVYGYALARGWAGKPGLLAVAMSSDHALRSAAGLALAVAGLVRRRLSIADTWWRARTKPHGP